MSSEEIIYFRIQRLCWLTSGKYLLPYFLFVIARSAIDCRIRRRSVCVCLSRSARHLYKEFTQ
ncbi:unnamed protein product [Cylicostephanus goldi]|uniref:Uncharacterized protein n=1 Tax=Cylicostephanus goldi TaxID=71465 RepID=A0A3P6THL6_CYLGO|nr:unnamed protein product [Cylicostephanus goldi]